MTSPSMLVAGTNVYTLAAKPLTIAPFAGKQVHMIAAAAKAIWPRPPKCWAMDRSQ